MRRLISFAAILLLTGFVWTPNLAAQKPRVIQLTAGDDLHYSMPSIAAKPGELITVVLKTMSMQPADQLSHNFVLLKTDVQPMSFVMLAAMSKDHGYLPPALKDKVIVSTDMASAGQSVSATFHAPLGAGTYPYLCTFPGHFAGGMKGTLVVKR